MPITDYYSGDPKQVKKTSESYVKEALSRLNTQFDRTWRSSDLEKPASIRFMTKGRRGNTDLSSP